MINNVVDEIQTTEAKVSAVNHEALKVLESDYDENDLSQVENMSLDESKEKSDWRKRALEYENSYVIENRNENIYGVKNISEWELLHDIINAPKLTKNINSH